MAGFVGLSLLGAFIYRVQKGVSVNDIYLNLQGHVQIYKKDSLQQFSIAPKKYLILPELDQKLEEVLESVRPEIEFQGKFLTGSGLIVSDKISQPFLGLGYDRSILAKALHHSQVSQWANSWLKVGVEQLTPENLANEHLISITPRIAEIIGRPKDLRNLTEESRAVQLITRTFQNDLNAVNADLGLIHTTGMSMSEDTSVRLPLSLLQELLATDGYEYRSLFLFDDAHMTSVQKKLNEEFQARQLPLQAYLFSEGARGEYYIGTMNFLYVMGCFFVFLICGMVVLSIVNSLTLGILERTRELGTLKALGFSSEQIVGIFVREAVWLAGMSIGLGLIVSLVIAHAVNAANFNYTSPNVEGELKFLLSPNMSLYTIFALALFFIAIFTSYRVSRKKMRSSPIELLNESGM
jgi:putative ABC transport system permease protein